MALHRPPAYCHNCGKQLEAVYKNQDNVPMMQRIIGDTFLRYKECDCRSKPIPAPSSTPQSVEGWEIFHDESYYGFWAVRPIGDRSFNSQRLFHVTSKQEAENLQSQLLQAQKEVERLKGLIEKAFNKGFNEADPFRIKTQYRPQALNDFKKENNL